MQAQLNNMELCPEFSEYDRLYPVELMLISQIIPFMFVIAKTKSAHHGLKRQCGLVPADLKNIQAIWPRSFDEECSVLFAVKCELADKSGQQAAISPCFSQKST